MGTISCPKNKIKEVGVREVRAKISALLDLIQKGEEVVILRRGKRIARLVPIDNTEKRFPDLRTLRKSISLKGKSLSRTVIQQRNEERY
jgi:prevent-host-death family protein